MSGAVSGAVIQSEINFRDTLLRKYQKTKTIEHQIAYKTQRNKVNALIRKIKGSYHKKLLNDYANNPIKFWDTLKKIYPSKSNQDFCSKNFEIKDESITRC